MEDCATKQKGFQIIYLFVLRIKLAGMIEVLCHNLDEHPGNGINVKFSS